MTQELSDDVALMFQDALSMQRQAVAQFEAGDIRDAAEKAWCAARNATNGMISAVTSVEPRSGGKTMEALRKLYRYNREVFAPVHSSYMTYLGSLHGECFYDGHCDPPEVFYDEINETLDYINHVMELARRYPYSITLPGWNTTQGSSSGSAE
jgi:hypothetical protein